MLYRRIFISLKELSLPVSFFSWLIFGKRKTVCRLRFPVLRYKPIGAFEPGVALWQDRAFRSGAGNPHYCPSGSLGNGRHIQKAFNKGGTQRGKIIPGNGTMYSIRNDKALKQKSLYVNEFILIYGTAPGCLHSLCSVDMTALASKYSCFVQTPCAKTQEFGEAEFLG